jgi:DNA-binding XRE family transcriptional regulator
MKNTYKHGFILFALPLGIAIMVAAISQFMNAKTEDPSTLPTQKNSLPSVSALIPSITSDIIFKESSVSKGIIFKHEHRSATLSGLADTYGSGVCIIDFNNDGYEDLFIMNGSGVTRRYGKVHWWNESQGSRLYQNIDGQYFKDVSTKFMKDTNDIEQFSGYGCAVDDMNNDGYLDIVFGRVNQVKILINKAGTSFSQQTIKLKAKSSSSAADIWPMSVTLWDWNKDGYQDIFIANFAKFKNDLKVGSIEYGYNQKKQFDSKKYSGQQNILLTQKVNSFPSDSIEFNSSYFNNFDRTLSITPLSLFASELKEQNSNFFVANATGSNSYVYSLTDQPKEESSPFNWIINKIKSPIVQVSRLTIQNKPTLVFTQHKQGGVQLYNSDEKVQEDLAWDVGLNSEKDNATQTWATLTTDINNDGLQDFVSARGFSTPHIDNHFKPQGSHNSIKLQNNVGLFNEALVSVNPMLSRSSRGAAYADFNNDGLIDIVFNNNNGFFSLYMNQSSKNNWVSFICEPLYLCRKSHWLIKNKQNKAITQQMFSLPEPFLSANQKRVHFGLGDRNNKVNLEVTFKGDKSLSFSQINPSSTYRVNLQTNTITSIEKGKVTEKLTVNSSYSALAQLLDLNLDALLKIMHENEALDEQQRIKLSQLLIRYKLENNEFSVSSSAEFLTLTSWLLNSINMAKPNDSILLKNIIRLIGGSESSLYVDHLVELIATLPEENFCQLTDELNYWFKEEEVLPTAKQLLKAPLTYRLSISTSAKIVVCGLNALSSTRDTTIGSSLAPLLTAERFSGIEQKLIQAATVRTLGFLKHSKSKGKIIDLCKTATDELIKAECIITLYKLGVTKKQITKALSLPAYPSLIYALHEDKVILDLFFQGGLETLPATISLAVDNYNQYKTSPQKTHFNIAHLNELLLAKTGRQKADAIHSLLALSKRKDIESILAKLNQLSPSSIDEYVDIVSNDTHKQTWFLPYVSSNKIVELVKRNTKGVQNFEHSYALAYQCSIRESISDICDKLLQLHFKMSMDEVETLLATSPIKLVHSLMSGNSTLQKVTALRLFNLSNTLQKNLASNQDDLNHLFSMLRINNSYSLIRKNQIDKEWLEAFIESAYQNNVKLDQDWLSQFADLIHNNEAATAKAA